MLHFSFCPLLTFMYSVRPGGILLDGHGCFTAGVVWHTGWDHWLRCFWDGAGISCVIGRDTVHTLMQRIPVVDPCKQVLACGDVETWSKTRGEGCMMCEVGGYRFGDKHSVEVRGAGYSIGLLVQQADRSSTSPVSPRTNQ